MLREDVTRHPTAGIRLGTASTESGIAGWKRPEASAQGKEVMLARAGITGKVSRFLSEREAAIYLGIPTDRLVGLRNSDLAMIKKGFKPHGPPPLWQGSNCIYATESLDEWLSSNYFAENI